MAEHPKPPGETPKYRNKMPPKKTFKGTRLELVPADIIDSLRPFVEYDRENLDLLVELIVQNLDDRMEQEAHEDVNKLNIFLKSLGLETQLEYGQNPNDKTETALLFRVYYCDIVTDDSIGKYLNYFLKDGVNRRSSVGDCNKILLKHNSRFRLIYKATGSFLAEREADFYKLPVRYAEKMIPYNDDESRISHPDYYR